MDRRDFLKVAGGTFLAGASCVYAFRFLTKSILSGTSEDSPLIGLKWGMVIDLNRCREDCTACLDACRHENNVAFHGDERWDIHWIRKSNFKRKFPASSIEISVPLLCNHCEDPPCVQVCPTGASYKRDDGIVIVDYHRCIGCRYCIIACPYNARYFNFKENHEWPNKDFPKRIHGVSESCTFCAHLLDKSKKPACVDACEKTEARALIFGNLNDPDSDISRLIANNHVRGIREDLGTKPKVYYIGL